MGDLELVILPRKADSDPALRFDRVRRIYDCLAIVYPLSTLLFHTAAHRRAVALSGIRDGMSVLEVATGSGEMFRRLVRANPGGATMGFDLSPNMASRTQRRARREFPAARTLCPAGDARFIPFRDEAFDVVVCCYLLELLPAADILAALGEFHRVLRRNGRLTLVAIGQNTELFNRIYRVLGRMVPSFWGRQVDGRLSASLQATGFLILAEEHLRQGLYPSRILIAQK